MNILVLNYEYPPIGGGAAPVAKSTAEMLATLGHKVVVITMSYRGLPAYEIVNGVEIYRLQCRRSKANICYPWEQLTYIFAAKRFLRKHLSSYSYDVCHTHFIIPTGMIAYWCKKKYGLPYVITAHEYFKHFGAMIFPKEDINALSEVLQRAMELPTKVVINKFELSVNYMIEALIQELNAAKESFPKVDIICEEIKKQIIKRGTEKSKALQK
jgi:glycosyltransferase involved in cell wall biosynthesis